MHECKDAAALYKNLRKYARRALTPKADEADLRDILTNTLHMLELGGRNIEQELRMAFDNFRQEQWDAGNRSILQDVILTPVSE